MTARARAVLRAIFGVLGLGVLLWLAWSSRAELGEVLRTVDAAWFALATGLGLAFTLSHALLFSMLLARHRASGARAAVAVFLASQPGKYVPGKVWSALMQSSLLPGQRTLGPVALANLELAAIALLQMATAGAACAAWPERVPAAVCVLGGIAATVAVVRWHPAAWLARRWPRWAERAGVSPGARDDTRTATLRLVALATASALLNLAASWAVVVAAVPALDAPAVAAVMASLYLAFAASMFAVPVPAGVGVREAAAVGLGALLAPGVAPAVLVSIALLARAWQLAVDALAFAAGGALLPRRAGSAPGGG